MKDPIILSSGVVFDKSTIVDNESSTKTKTGAELYSYICASNCVFRYSPTSDQLQLKFDNLNKFTMQTKQLKKDLFGIEAYKYLKRESIGFGSWKVLNGRTI